MWPSGEPVRQLGSAGKTMIPTAWWIYDHRSPDYNIPAVCYTRRTVASQFNWMTQPLQTQPDPDGFVRLGGWLFSRRSWLPLPLVAALLLAPSLPPTVAMLAVGMATVAAGELVRLWAVRHIGVISRTRSDRLGPLIATGPFGLVRNPLYIGNVLLWVGFTVSAGLLWLAPVVIAVLGVEYHAIVRWEERLLEARIGEAYWIYARRVPRWNPFSRTLHVARRESVASRESHVASRQPSVAERFLWRETLFSERGTLLAILVGYGLLWLKSSLS